MIHGLTSQGRFPGHTNVKNLCQIQIHLITRSRASSTVGETTWKMSVGKTDDSNVIISSIMNEKK